MSAVIITAGIAVILFYKNSNNIMPRRYLYLCALLRSICIVLIILGIINGRFIRHAVTETQAKLAVLIDRSSSMNSKENGMSRSAIVESLLKTEAFLELSERHNISLFNFSDSLWSSNFEHTATESASGTDFNSVFTEFAKRISLHTTGGILMFSDGRRTRGANGLIAAEKLDKKIWTVCVGDTGRPPDVMISQVTGQKRAYAGMPYKMKIRIAASGNCGNSVRLRISSGSRALKDSIFDLPDAGFSKEVECNLIPSEPGLHSWKVEVLPVSGEVQLENNIYMHWARVAADKRRLLILAGRPGSDVAAFIRACRSDKHLELIVGIQKNDGQFYGRALSASFDSIDAVVLWDYPCKNSHSWTAIKEKILSLRLPFCIVAGSQLDISGLLELGDYLPWQGLKKSVPKWEVPILTTDGKSHDFFASLRGDITGLDSMEDLPPVFTEWTIDANDALIVSEDGVRPLLLQSRSDNIRRLMLIGEGYFKWQLIGAMHNTGSLLSFSHMATWLCAERQSGNIIYVDKPAYQSGENVRVSLYLKDDLGRPVRGRLPLVRIISNNNEMYLSLREGEAGHYQADLRHIRQGMYRAFLADSTLFVNADTARYQISPFYAEYFDQRADPVFMQRLSSITEGLSASSDSAEYLFNRIRLEPLQTRTVKTYCVRDSRITLFLIVLFFGVEWWIRRQWGLA